MSQAGIPREGLIPVICPHCGQGFGYETQHEATVRLCPHCQHAVRMPLGGSRVHSWLVWVVLVIVGVQLGGCVVKEVFDFQRREQEAVLRVLHGR